MKFIDDFVAEVAASIVERVTVKMQLVCDNMAQEFEKKLQDVLDNVELPEPNFDNVDFDNLAERAVQVVQGAIDEIDISIRAN